MNPNDPKYKARHKTYRYRNPIIRNKLRKENYDLSKPPKEIIKRRPSGIKHRRWELFEIQSVQGNPLSDMELSKIIKRSVQAIQMMRCKLKKDQ